jgi:hypothetical protein
MTIWFPRVLGEVVTRKLNMFVKLHKINISIFRGGSRGARTPPKIGKNIIFLRKIVIFHTKYPKNVHASLRNWKKYDFLGVKSWFFTRNTPTFFEPPSARRNFLSATPLTWNPGSAPVGGILIFSFGHCIVGGRRGRDRMVVGFTTTYAISAYHLWCHKFESQSGRGV